MGALSFVRFARRFTGLSQQQELPNLEALLEAESGKPHDVYKILRLVIPLCVAVIGGATTVLARLSGAASVPLAVGTGVTFVLAFASWFVFNELHKAIPETTRRLRKRTNALLARYAGFASVVGFEQALDPQVGTVLDEAAGIYLKHASTPSKGRTSVMDDARLTAVQALESAMAGLLELAEPSTAQTQQQALAAGWAEPLLLEMRELDTALDAHARIAATERAARGNETLAGLRDARLGLQKIDSAIEELDERLSDGA